MKAIFLAIFLALLCACQSGGSSYTSWGGEIADWAADEFGTTPSDYWMEIRDGDYDGYILIDRSDLADLIDSYISEKVDEYRRDQYDY